MPDAPDFVREADTRFEVVDFELDFEVFAPERALVPLFDLEVVPDLLFDRDAVFLPDEVDDDLPREFDVPAADAFFEPEDFLEDDLDLVVPLAERFALEPVLAPVASTADTVAPAIAPDAAPLRTSPTTSLALS